SLTHNADGTWDTSAVQGMQVNSLNSTNPSLIVFPFHQASNVVSIRQFTNNAMNHHHGMQSEERFGIGVDTDGDGFVNELTGADMTAISIFQAALAVPGRVIPHDPVRQAAVANGEKVFDQIGCNSCHMDSLPLHNWMFVEPNPFNPAANLQ